ncbi:Cytochrome b561 domain-containing protein [Mycena chlorophos]|uniref:Cytochrome b561 domain-containing protein n=1 Tax=Mycena chlorophos TaxID=658473 RepID=A0A8H6STM1_MYCCL|nr:Cytochrome b561 domain-containing protein [Mycena chlorophos]
MSTSTIPLSPFESKARIHAHIGFFAFVFGLPVGILIARYLRTFINHWFWPHAIVNLVFVGPLVLTTFILGHQLVEVSEGPHFYDIHQRVGLALLLLYFLQVFLGIFIHFVKFPALAARMPGGRNPQNYLHGLLGLVIVLLGCWQTHYGLWHEWAFATGNVHPVTWHCRDFWLGIVVAFWTLYIIGLVFLRRQYRQEKLRREKPGEKQYEDVPLI